MENETNHHTDRRDSGSTQILLSASVSVLAWVCGAVLGLGGLVIRLWTAGIESDVLAIRGDVAQCSRNISTVEARESEDRHNITQLRREVDDHEQRIRWHQSDGHSHRHNERGTP